MEMPFISMFCIGLADSVVTLAIVKVPSELIFSLLRSVDCW